MITFVKRAYRACTLLVISLSLLISEFSIHAQVSLSTSELVWESSESGTKYVTVTSSGGNGRWECDSTLYSNHFQVSPQSGNSGASVAITPLSTNTGEAIDGSIAFFNPNTGTWAVLNLVHRGTATQFAVSPQSLSWAAAQTHDQTVYVSGTGWSSSISGSGFVRTENTSAGTITVHPDGANTATTARNAELVVTDGTDNLYVSLFQAAGSGGGGDGGGGNTPGSITISPSSTITWSPYETESKYVVVSSTTGAWRKDTCSLGPHFSMSPTLGPSGELVWFTPSGANETLGDIEDAVFIETNYGDGGVQITLVHEHDPYLIKPSPDSLVWTADQTGWQSVSITSAISWTARIAGGGFALETESGSGCGTLRAHPNGVNPTTSDIVVWLEFSAPGARTRSVKLIQKGRSTPIVIPDTFTGTPGMRIPISRSVTPTGAVTYSVPIFTDPSAKFTPGIGLVYGSQSGNGIAGYGWHVSGLSSITLIPKNRYYHGKNKAADVNGSDHSYALDGVPLVESEEYADGTTSYPLKTVSGHVRVKRTASGFEALYPDGSKAVFGEGPATDGNTRLVYPVVRKEDILGNEITFGYLMDGGTCYPQTICYDTGLAAPDTIRFTYTDRSDYVPQYNAGVEVSVRKLLTGMTSSAGGDLLRAYTLSHGTIYGVSCLLELGCSTVIGNSTESLEPLRFEYGGGTGMPTMTFDADYVQTSVVSPYGDTNEESGYRTSRGKFLATTYKDGLLVVPNKNSYTMKPVTLPGEYTIGSDYSNEDTFSFIPSVGSSEIDIGVGDGFQDVQAVDCDGDGIDEVVRVGLVADKNTEKSKLLIAKFSYDPSPNLSRENFINYLDGYFDNGDDTPFISGFQQRIIQYGSLTNDGHTQLIATSIAGDINGEHLSSTTAVVDLVSGELLAEAHLFDITLTTSKYLFVTDLDGDGISEICHITNGGTEIYGFRDNGSFGFLRSYSILTRPDLVNGFQLADINGDGKLDFVCTSNLDDAWNVFCFTGNTFVKKKYVFGKTDYSTKVLFMDLNKDGLQDMLRLNINGSVTYRLNVGGSMATEEMAAPFTIPYKSEVLQGNVLDFRGSTGLVVVNEGKLRGYDFNGDYQSLRLATKMRDGFHNEYTDSYTDISESGMSFSNPGGDAPQNGGYSERSIPIQVVHESRLTSGGILQESTSHSYRNAILSTEGAGFVCFGSVTESQSIGRQTVVTHYAADAMGAPSSVETIANITGGSVQTRTASYTFAADTNAFGHVVDARMVEASVTDMLKGVSEGTVTIYDGYGLPLTVTTSRRIGNGSPKTETKTISYSHGLSDSLYVLGAVAEEQSYKGSLASKTDYTLDVLKRPTRTKTYAGTISGGSTSWNLTSDRIFTYDAHGNVTSDRSAAYGATTYNESTYTFDAIGRYMTTSTDPIGQTITYDLYSKYGQPVTVYDRLAHETDYGYDAWGRPIFRFLPDGTDEYISYSWSASGEPGLYCVSKTLTGQPDTKVWYDALGREVRSANKRFDGSWQYVTTEYDSRGRLYRTSLPYKNTATGPTLWNTYTYDNYNRPISLSEASGRQTTWSYSGTSTTTVKDSLVTTSTTDAEGNVVRVVDAGGAIIYSLRDDGQPSAVTVTPYGTNQNIVTSFTYDAYGRRTAIIDPSAGTRTDTYTDNADGTSSIAHTGPNGTVTSYYDRFGRVTSVTRPEFNTSYTYSTDIYSGSYGKLLSEVSTNGTSRIFTYDGYGRPVTETEHPDITNWLRRTYTYGAGSNVASINYTTQGGSITTETFSYANGHNTGIAASGPGNTSINVFTLTSENALGQPTAVTTGTVNRTYGYTAAGLPASRMITRAGGTVVQNFSYSYNANSGNLYSRTDIVPGQDGPIPTSEAFQYDSLNRLRLAHMDHALPDPPDSNSFLPSYIYDSISASYDSKGNILTRGAISNSYGNASDPYSATASQWSDGSGTTEPYAPGRRLTMTSFDRPAVLSDTLECMTFANYEYDASGGKAWASFPGIGIERRYLGGVFEKDIRVWEQWSDDMMDWQPRTETVQRLFLGGTAYDAPMVLVKEEDGDWTPYNIGRDVQGSITHVLTKDGALLERYIYDPWGGVERTDSTGTYVDTLAVVDTFGGSGGGWSRIVGSHGYTGHEVIAGVGIINANARLYDPATGRFLSPDPLVQDPASTQNFNRYSYCLNNPLKYTDESGEYFIIDSFLKGYSDGGLEEAKKRAINDAKLWLGLFNVDKNDNPFQAAWHLLLRFTWELPQTVLGFGFAQAMNYYGTVESVDYIHGVTVTRSRLVDFGAFTLGCFITGENDIKVSDDDYLFQHEFGHTLQSRNAGPIWLVIYGLPSLVSAGINDNNDAHNNILVERDANARALSYFVKYDKDFMTFDSTSGEYSYKWDFDKNPIKGYDRKQSIYDDFNKEAIIRNKLLRHLTITINKKRNDGENEVVFTKTFAL